MFLIYNLLFWFTNYLDIFFLFLMCPMHGYQYRIRDWVVNVAVDGGGSV